MTYGEEFDLALACNTQEEADEFVRTNIAHRVKDFGQTPEEAEKVLKGIVHSTNISGDSSIGRAKCS